jgi:hypothetical protein
MKRKLTPEETRVAKHFAEKRQAALTEAQRFGELARVEFRVARMAEDALRALAAVWTGREDAVLDIEEMTLSTGEEDDAPA